MYTKAQYRRGLTGAVACIHVEINGVESYVPLDPGNADYLAIMALVSAGTLEILPAE